MRSIWPTNRRVETGPAGLWRRRVFRQQGSPVRVGGNRLASAWRCVVQQPVQLLVAFQAILGGALDSARHPVARISVLTPPRTTLAI
jgi:hypothetical protein